VYVRAHPAATLARTLLLAITVSASVRAEPEYPEVVQEAAGLTCPAPCTLCHTRESGGLQYITPFGRRIWTLGIRPGHPETIATTLRCMRERNCPSAPGEVFDTDGDGVSDTDELDQGRHPGRAGDVAVCGASYGCGARVATRETLSWRGAALLGSSVLGALWLIRHRARCRSARALPR
jgi:hypothetical protein